MIGTPASISASVAPQTEAIELEPFDSRMSLTTRSVYGKLLLVRDHRRQSAFGQMRRGRFRDGLRRA